MRLIDADALMKEAGKLWATMPDGEELSKELMKAINHAPTVAKDINVPGWISVKDRLPDGECIAYSTKWFEMIIGYIYKATASDTGYEAESENEVLRDVTHWMTLPEPPEEVSGNG
ncbi:MAG: DUF551 domain-containing protein [Clostridia bacterium]|nr:DUF551 domain-containing protein [Clostridia bacterium]